MCASCLRVNLVCLSGALVSLAERSHFEKIDSCWLISGKGRGKLLLSVVMKLVLSVGFHLRDGMPLGITILKGVGIRKVNLIKKWSDQVHGEISGDDISKLLVQSWSRK